MDDEKLLRKLGALAREQREAPAAEAPALDEADRARIADHIVRNLAPPKRPRGRVIALAAGGLALAAALVLSVGRRPSASLPAYAFDDRGAAELRAPAPAGGPCKIHVKRHGEFELVARPASASDGDVDRPGAWLFLAKGASVERASIAPDVSERGTVRVTGATTAIADGDELRLVLGKGLDESEARTHAKGSADRGQGWQMLRCAVDPAP